MSFSDLATAICNTEFKIEQNRQALRSVIDSNMLLEICDMYRCIGCGSYLMDLDKDEFTKNLYFSGKSYLFLLKKVHSKNLPDHLGWRSKGDAWLDVIAIGATDLALELSAFSADDCDDDQGEIEEDFLYFKLLEGLYLKMLSDKEVNDILKQFEESSDGGDSERFQVINSLCKKDDAAFDQYFCDMIESWKDSNIHNYKIGRLNPYYFLTISKIFIEGLAIIRLAKQLGLTTEPEYPFIPADLIQHQAIQFPIGFELI
ncbi:hypothetical protein Dvar_59870 [Desulfosarcina variabilis str. Montpellier]|uniref:hypothetical protein n=1 Tax=Desulfosarcina variabilis TaxID=2300 RepID=UPI003AFB7BCC